MVQMTPADQAVVMSMPGNRMCCDCGMKSPQWASVSFGNVFCLDCSGVHRYVCDSKWNAALNLHDIAHAAHGAIEQISRCSRVVCAVDCDGLLD
jgi:Putative GTPase activating protein for Arf